MRIIEIIIISIIERMISVCVPLYNGSDYVEECIKSILNQTFQNFELIISDDCSTDNSLEVLEKYKQDGRITIFSNSENMGWVKNCNLLISKTNFDYFCIIPCDDFIPINYLEVLYNSILNENGVVNCYPYIITFGDMDAVHIYQNDIFSDDVGERIVDFILNHFSGVSFRGLIKKSHLPELLYLNEKIENGVWVDTFQICQHALSGKMKSVDVPYFKRMHKGSTHNKWVSSDKDLVDFYIGVYMLVKNYLTNMDDVSNAIQKRQLNGKSITEDFSSYKLFDCIIMGGGIQGCCAALALEKKAIMYALSKKINH